MYFTHANNVASEQNKVHNGVSFRRYTMHSHYKHSIIHVYSGSATTSVEQSNNNFPYSSFLFYSPCCGYLLFQQRYADRNASTK